MFPIKELKERLNLLTDNNIKSYADELRFKRLKIAREYFETEEGKRELFENRNIELILEIYNFAREIDAK